MSSAPNPINVAFLHDKLLLGGSVHVSHQTALMFKQYNIKSIFFARDIDSKTFSLPKEHYNLEILPQGKLLSNEQEDFIIKKILELDIKILFIATNLREIPTRIKQETNCKIVYWLHSAPFWEVITKNIKRISHYRFYPQRALFPLAKGFIKLQYYSTLRRRKKIYLNILKKCDAYIVLCEEYKQDILLKLPEAQEFKNKIHPIINTIEPSEEKFLKKEKEIVYMGRLSYNDKRVDRLIRIWDKIYKKLPDWKCKIYGTGEEENNLKKLIKDLKTERITLEGYTSDPQAIYKKASILCLTSNFEGVPLCIIEAQNFGVIPVAFSCVAGINYIIGKNAGILIPPFKEDLFAQKLYELCGNDSLRKRLQNECLSKRLEYSNKINHNQWIKIFKLADIDFNPTVNS